MSEPSPIRVRFAPSPTGLLHIGGLRTALYNALFARKHGGTFVLRIEDTDRERFVDCAEADILGALRWAGLAYDEGPDVGGPFGPYRQSERTALYDQYARRLLDAGHAYVAFDTPEELDAMRARLASPENPAPRYDAATRGQMANSLTLSEAEVRRRMQAGMPHVVRLRVPEGETVTFTDIVRGEVAIDTREVDDQVLVKSDGLPTYHLANVVDDHLMEISHVIRGEEWLPSTPKHILLYRFLGWTPPQMAHLPLILSPTGGKLSKRNAEKEGIPVFVSQYRLNPPCPDLLAAVAGDLRLFAEPEALVNFLAFLGWNPGDEREVFSLDELTEAFSLERIGSSGVQVSLDKLNWFNGQHLRAMPIDTLAERARPHLEKHGLDPDDLYFEAVVDLMRERITLAEDLATEAAYFFEAPTTYDPAGVKKRWKADAADLLAAYADRLAAAPAFDAETIEAVLRGLAEAREAGAGRIIHPTRLAISGVSGGPSLFHMMEVLGRDACVRRIRKAIAVLG